MRFRPKHHRFLSIVACLLSILAQDYAVAQTTGILLSDDRNNIVYAKNEETSFIPASTLKIITSLAALETLGKNYRFSTWVDYDPKTKTLYVKGFGDPLFISEEIESLVEKLIAKTKLRSVHNIVLDHSFFHPDIAIPGTGNSKNPYDATTGALCANFNTIFFQWDETKSRYISAEHQTPLLDNFQDHIKSLNKSKDRVLLSHTQRRIYPGLLIRYFLTKKKIKVSGDIKEGSYPDSPHVKLEYKSSVSLEEIIEKLLKYSNNFIANQLVLVMGAKHFGPPATLEKGVTYLNGYIETKLGIQGIHLTEGSGLSRKNRMSPRQMMIALMEFMPYHYLMSKDKNEFYKTGTLSDVKTRAGYIRGKDNRLYPFVIMLNQTWNGYGSIRKALNTKVIEYSRSP